MPAWFVVPPVAAVGKATTQKVSTTVMTIINAVTGRKTNFWTPKVGSTIRLRGQDEKQKVREFPEAMANLRGTGKIYCVRT